MRFVSVILYVAASVAKIDNEKPTYIHYLFFLFIYFFFVCVCVCVCVCVFVWPYTYTRFFSVILYVAAIVAEF